MTKKFSELKIGEEFMLMGYHYVKTGEPALNRCLLPEQPTNAICIDNGHHITFSSKYEIPCTVVTSEATNDYDKIKFTDAEYRILLAAMRREKKLCSDLNKELLGIKAEVDLIEVCNSIVKKLSRIQHS